jgi:hypothetical protein
VGTIDHLAQMVEDRSPYATRGLADSALSDTEKRASGIMQPLALGAILAVSS